MEKERSLSLEVEKLGKNEEIQRELDRSRTEEVGRPQDLAPAGEKNLQPTGGNGDL